MSKCAECKKFDDCRTGSGLVWPCGAFVPNKPITNADRYRSMSDEELAVEIMCPYSIEPEMCNRQEACIECCLEYLKQPVEEE